MLNLIYDAYCTDPLRSHVLSGASAHLFVLYPHLVHLLTSVAKGGLGGGPSNGMVGADGDDEMVIDTVSACLNRVGQVMGMVI